MNDPRAIAERLRQALLNAKTNNLLAASDTPAQPGTSHGYKLVTPYRGKGRLEAVAVTPNQGDESILLASDSGWLAFSNSATGTQQQRRDIERGTLQEQIASVDGKVGYCWIALIKRRASILHFWSYYWQIWIGGWTANNLLVKEIEVTNNNSDGAIGTTPYAVLDLREEKWFLSLHYSKKISNFTTEIRLAYFEGDMSATIDTAGVSNPAPVEKWDKSLAEIMATGPTITQFLTLRCQGFGYWSSQSGSFTQTMTPQSNLNSATIAIHDGALTAYPLIEYFNSGLNRSSGPTGFTDTQTVRGSYKVPMGWNTSPETASYSSFYTSSFQEQQLPPTYIGTYSVTNASANNFTSKNYCLHRIGEDGETGLALILDESYAYASNSYSYEFWNAGPAPYERGATGSINTNHKKTSILANDTVWQWEYNYPQIFVGNGTGGGGYVGTATTQETLSFQQEGGNLPHILKQGKNPDKLISDLPSGDIVTGIGGAGTSVLSYSPLFCDVYSKFISAIEYYSLLNRDDPNGNVSALGTYTSPTFLQQLFPELTGGSPSDTNPLHQGIERMNKTCVVHLHNSGLTSRYGPQILEIETFKINQLDPLLNTGNGLLTLDKYFFCNASFAADNAS